MAVLSIIYGFITRGSFTLAYVFNANFLLGAIIIAVAVMLRFFSFVFIRFDKLSDHSNFSERVSEQYMEKQQKSNEFLFLGLLITIITGLIQLAIAVLTGSLSV